jgi:hypothetical protein
MIPVNKLGWMAGIIDLKGRVIEKRNKTRNTRQLVLAVRSKEVFIIRELSSLTGTKPEFMSVKKLSDWMRKGCIEHCPEPHFHVGPYDDNWSMPATAQWTITGVAMATVLDNLSPYLLSDRGYQDAYEEITSQATLEGQGSGMTFKVLRRLKELGWELPEQFEIGLEQYDGKEV